MGTGLLLVSGLHDSEFEQSFCLNTTVKILARVFFRCMAYN